MKKLIHTIFLLSLVTSLNAQNIAQKVERDFLEYSRLTIEKKLDEALDYSNPRLFEIIRREQMKNLLSAVYNSPGIEYSITMPNIVEIEPVVKIDGRNFVRFKSKAAIHMKFADILDDQTKIDNVTKSFEAKFGAENVTFDKVSGFFKIKTTKLVIGESNNEMENWKFAVIDNPKSRMILEKIIPTELFD